MPGRHAWTDAEWSLVEPHLPARSKGRAWADHRRTVNGVPFWASTGIRWGDLPTRFGPWQAAHERFRRWRDDGTWGRLLGHPRRQADRAGRIDWSRFCLDPTTARARRSAAGGKNRPARRAARPRPRAEPGRVHQHSPPRHGRARIAAGGAGDGRPGAWEPVAGGGGRGRSPAAAGPGAAPLPAAGGGRGRGVQPPPHPPRPRPPGHPGGHPPPLRPAAGRRAGELRPAVGRPLVAPRWR
jgi:transposase